MKFVTLAFVSSLAVANLVTPALEAEPAANRDTASLLFESPDWTKAPAGATISYAYARKTYGNAELGESFDDTIVLKLDRGEDAQSRKVDVRMFSGPRQRPAGPFDSMSNNPVLLLVFENHIQALSRLLQGNPLYFKSAIRRAWRDAATIEDLTLTVGGTSVPGTRIAIHPFLNDPMKDRMKGLDGMTYVVDIADSVPGKIVAIDIHAPADGAPKFSETLTYQAEITKAEKTP